MVDVVVETRGRVRWLVLNRPHRLNAFTWDTRDELLAALDEAAESDVDAIVLTGTGRGFCAGVDMEAVLHGEADAPAAERRAQLERTHEVVQRMRDARQPVVALVNGVAAGGGWSLALGADVIVAADTARFVTAFSQLGLVPDLGAAFHLPRRVGAMRAKSIIMRGQSLTAHEALVAGAVDVVLPSDDLEERLERLLPDIIREGKGA